MRLDRKRPGNGDALALPPGKLVRITVLHLRGKPDLSQEVVDTERARLRVTAAYTQRHHSLFDYVHDPHAWIKGAVGVLKDDLQMLAAHAQLARGKRRQVHATVAHASAGQRYQSQDAFSGGGLAAAGFADQRQCAPRTDRQRHAVYRFDMPDDTFEQPLADREVGLEVVDL